MCDISAVKNLACASKEEQRKFLDSFDHVLSDMDGVLWTGYKPLPHASECINKLKKLGKRITYISNNSSISLDDVHHLLQKSKFPANKEDIFTPTQGYIDYLTKINFKKLLFVIGAQGLKDQLTKAGFQLAPNSADPVEESIPVIIEAITDNEEIGAVIADFEINITLLKLQKCLTYLKRPDCIFLTGAGDKILPFPQNGPLIGNHYFLECLKEFSGRKPYQLAKPSPEFKDFIINKVGITDPEKVLLIGDSINEDMKFASVGGYRKLMVLTGNTKKEEIINWRHDVGCKPDYYVDSLSVFNLILGMLHLN